MAADTVSFSPGSPRHMTQGGKIFRDSEGRSRCETVTGVGADGVYMAVLISDPVARVSINLDPQTKVATVTRWSPGQTGAAKRFPGEKSQSYEGLGTREIEGFTVLGTRGSVTAPPHTGALTKAVVFTAENWFSSDLKISLLVTHESSAVDGSEASKWAFKVVHIRLGEPDAALFQVPEDYTARDKQAPISIGR